MANEDINKLKDELENIEERIKSIASLIGTAIAGNLIKSTREATKLTDEFNKGKDISKQVATQIFNLGTKQEIALLKEDSLRKQINKAIDEGNAAEVDSLTVTLRQVNAERKMNELIETQLRKLEQLNEERKKQNDLLGLARNLLKDTFYTPLKQMFTLASIFKIIIDAAINFNKISVEVGKNLGYGADNADRVTRNLVKVAQNSNNINVTLKNAGEAMSELNNATGLVAEYSADALETQIMLTKQFGLTGEEAAGIYKFSLLTGKASSKINDEMVGAFVAARNSFKVGANFRQVMAEAAKVSGQLAANLGYNPERITKAVVAMKAFGTTLEQTKSQGESLLNFESSIENELKAELLTGQQMNLERARAAALAGDQVKLAEELVNQGMTLDKFSKMNVLAQKAYAEALGLSADQLSGQLQKQKIAQEQGKSLAQLTKEEAIKAEKRQNIQDKFNAAILKLQDLIGNLVAGPLGSVLTILTNSLGILEKMMPVLGPIVAAFGTLWTLNKGIVAMEGLGLGFQVAMAANKKRELTVQAALNIAKGEELTTQIGIAAAWAIANPFKALFGLAIAAGVGALVYNSMKKGDDVISPGYGQRVLSTPEGSIALNNNDTIVAGTNLNRGGGNNTETNSLLRQLIGTTQTVANKQSIINMDGKKVGTTLTQNSYRVA